MVGLITMKMRKQGNIHMIMQKSTLQHHIRSIIDSDNCVMVQGSLNLDIQLLLGWYIEYKMVPFGG